MNDAIRELQELLSLIEADEQVVVQSPADTGQLQKLKKMKAVVNNEVRIFEEVFNTLSMLGVKLDEAIDKAEEELERMTIDV